jgi:hypothetical protein
MRPSLPAPARALRAFALLALSSLTLSTLVLPSLGCGGAMPREEDEKLHKRGPGMPDKVACAAIASAAEIDVLGMDPGTRAYLASKRSQGAVAVRWAVNNCKAELEILPCIAKRDYEFSSSPASDTRVTRNGRDLYIDMPTGVTRLASKFEDENAVRASWTVNGFYRMENYEPPRPSQLSGSSCERATHVVAKIIVGGFTLVSGPLDTIDATKSREIFGVEAEIPDGLEKIASEGNPAACEKARQENRADPLCSVPLRIGLLNVKRD